MNIFRTKKSRKRLIYGFIGSAYLYVFGYILTQDFLQSLKIAALGALVVGAVAYLFYKTVTWVESGEDE